jgi:hypothetical protein
MFTGAKTERRGSGHGSFSLAAEESGLSRVLIGFHFCKAVEAAIEHARDRQPRGRPLPAARARAAGTSRGPMTTRHRVVPVGGAVRTEIERVHAATTAAWARRQVNGRVDRLLLGLLEVGVGAGGVVGDVDDAVDLGDRLGDRYFDALAEGDCGHAAALTPSA